MKTINLENFILESFDYDNKEHFRMVSKFDLDKEINTYIISEGNSFCDVIDCYRLYDKESIYNKIYMVKTLEGEIIGSIELDGEKDNLYINYCILKEYRCKGYCTKLLKEITKYLLDEINCISLLIKQENEKSRKLALRVGYNKIGYYKYGYDKYQINSII